MDITFKDILACIVLVGWIILRITHTHSDLCDSIVLMVLTYYFGHKSAEYKARRATNPSQVNKTHSS